MSDGSGSEGETYEVEKILDKKIVKGKTQYFIKWKGEFKEFLRKFHVINIWTGCNRQKTWFIKLLAAMLDPSCCVKHMHLLTWWFEQGLRLRKRTLGSQLKIWIVRTRSRSLRQSSRRWSLPSYSSSSYMRRIHSILHLFSANSLNSSDLGRTIFWCQSHEGMAGI